MESQLVEGLAITSIANTQRISYPHPLHSHFNCTCPFLSLGLFFFFFFGPATWLTGPGTEPKPLTVKAPNHQITRELPTWVVIQDFKLGVQPFVSLDYVHCYSINPDPKKEKLNTSLLTS